MQVRKQQWELDMEQQTSSKSGKEYVKVVYWHPAYLTYTQSTSWEILGEAQAGIKIVRRNINNLRYADDTTLMAESKEELKSLLMKVKEEWEIWLKTQHSEKQDHGIWSHHFITNRWETMEMMTDFILGGSKITADGDFSHEIKRHLLLRRKPMIKLDSILKSIDITLPTLQMMIAAMKLKDAYSLEGKLWPT